ncbi:type I-E CRISPR-associated protein Cse2/CasB [Streptomyces sp. NPDC004111]|uniref:type I-E CRISPR-associated protein Cse2/CasB n=1 Tax=Streptomyces sp. NPDC004111 TaxID=3364690 RepID=UPI0036751BF5
MLSSRDERRRHYDTYTAHIHDLCHTPAIRRTLEKGRGRPVSDCPDLIRYLAQPTRHHYGRRAHYTVASLIARQYPRHQQHPDDPNTTPSTPHKEASSGDSTESQDPLARWNRRPNLGTTLACAVHAGDLSENTTPRQLRSITRLSENLLHPRLFSLTRQLAQAGHTVDFAVLLEDLVQWPEDRPRVTQRWLTGYYLALPVPTSELR